MAWDGPYSFRVFSCAGLGVCPGLVPHVRPGPAKAAETFRRIWGFKSVLKHAVLGGFKAYEFGIPRPTYAWRSWMPVRQMMLPDMQSVRPLRRNLTLVQNHVHRGDALLSRYLRQAALLFGLPGGLNSYTTPALAVGLEAQSKHHMLNVAWMGAGFGYHFDPSDAIILQVEGNKQGPQTTWEICGRRFPNAFSFANLTYNQAMPRKNPFWIAFLCGYGYDQVSLPTTTYHSNKALSIHLTMSLNRQRGPRLKLRPTPQSVGIRGHMINPSKEFGFARSLADLCSSMAALHAVPQSLRCRPRGKQRFCPAWRGFLDDGLAGKALAKDPPGLPE
ncbi:unnamed protein product, partial [Symbiodinium necroappetens]